MSTRAATSTITVTPTAMAEAGFLPLLCWLSPSFPVGAYAYSHGLEWAVEAGDLRDEASLESWLSDILHDGFGRNDAILLCAAYRAAASGSRAGLDAANELALAMAGSAEFRLETAQQGRSFLDAVGAAWPHERLGALAGDLDEVALPVALGLASACHGIDLAATAKAYLVALAQNLVSAAIRLAPIGQTSGQRVLARLVPALSALADETLTLGLDDVGSATFRADLGSFRHETQYTRLFRS
ncbi:urease accessory protein UreF [Enterovirga sp. CN4-39]|uniref:urease accessory protein UreF n=1 Tax=Enterovirga sp. CN4-39 TaxID=3400910 RepID=UPI003C0164C7